RDGTVEVRVVNAAADRPRAIPVPALGRRVTVEVAGLEPGASYRLRPAGDNGPEALAHTGPDGLVRTTLDLPMPGSRTLRLAPDRPRPHPAKEDPGP
ncbi:hypothetical protein GT034_12060, partial [Streptomyces sp. SID2563]|nr:hypothetical protein [Streptomyces sp. SID2563]